jgi:DNA-directed RNA polymerase subunit RPC12/RpoP
MYSDKSTESLLVAGFAFLLVLLCAWLIALSRRAWKYAGPFRGNPNNSQIVCPFCSSVQHAVFDQQTEPRIRCRNCGNRPWIAPALAAAAAVEREKQQRADKERAEYAKRWFFRSSGNTYAGWECPSCGTRHHVDPESIQHFMGNSLEFSA